ncbi:MAG: hypothetical protein IKT77_06730, partial [Paludibacteraceae bacterium]|nr:hypothetical protein [Paludibacteraceae bacterium]
MKNYIIRVFGLLNERAEYAVLRNYEGLPERNESRDIDIIITRRGFRSIKRELVDTLCQEGWRIVTYLNSDRLITFVCAKNVGNETEIVQWDFFLDTSVWGVELMSAEEFVEHRVWNGFLWHVDIVGEFLDKYLYNRAVGAAYPAKYEAIRRRIFGPLTEDLSHTEPKVFEPKAIKCTDDTEDAVALPALKSELSVKSVGDKTSRRVESKLSQVFGCGDLEVCDGLSGKRLLGRAVWWNLKRRPFGLIAGVCAFLWSFVRNYICTNTGFAIGFTGPDGVGKTTVIEMLIGRLGGVFRTAHSYMHFRPMLFGNLGEVAHSAGLKREVDRNYNDPHRGKKVGVMSSLVRLVYYSVDYIVGYWLKVKSQIRITRLVVFDRYYTDVICDSRRSRIFLNYRFLYWFGRVFIPQLDYNILLTAEVDTILARKQELTREGIEAINERIEFLAGKKGYV